MAFKKVDSKAELEKVLSEDPNMDDIVDLFNKEYNFIQSLVRLRNEKGLTQKEVAEKSGLTQQMVSRIEIIDYSPTLKNLLKYINAIGAIIEIKRL